MSSPVPTVRQHVLGVSMVVGVAVIWVLSAVLIQYIFGESSFNKPYFLTYISTSLFSTFLLGFLHPSWRAAFRRPPHYHPVEASTYNAVAMPKTRSFNVKETFFFAVRLAPTFFLTSWTYNFGLALTTVASSSTINTLTTLFALVIGAAVGTERFSLSNLAATVMTIVGVALISSQDSSDGEGRLAGDLLSLFSAISYAVYGIELKNKACQADLDVVMVQAFVGVVILLGAWPGLIVLHALGVEVFEVPSQRLMALLFCNGLFGTVLSEFLFAQSVVLTTPMVSSLAISLAIPLSLLADMFVQSVQFSVAYLVGTVFVLVAFFLVNWDMVRIRRKDSGAPVDVHP